MDFTPTDGWSVAEQSGSRRLLKDGEVLGRVHRDTGGWIAELVDDTGHYRYLGRTYTERSAMRLLESAL